MARRAAVVIGVNETGGLGKLSSPADGAREVAEWLRGEGFDVTCLTDEDAPVGAGDVEDAIAAFVTTPPRYHQLIVYFSGHGYWHARSDLWLLSGAPTRTSDAINLEGAIDLAKYSGIPSVVFVSDACRSIPRGRAEALIRGVDGFPNHAEIETPSKVDVFRATSEATSAWEGPVEGGTVRSLLTAAWRSAYETPRPDMVRTVTEDGQTVKVVPNRALEDFLQERVNELLDGIDPGLNQVIEAAVLSTDDVYVARVREPVASPPAAPAPPPPDQDEDQDQPRSGARFRVLTRPFARRRPTVPRNEPDGAPGGRPGVPRPGSSPPRHDRVEMILTEPASDGDLAFPGVTTEAVDARLPGPGPDHYESGVGFIVHGAAVARATCTRRAAGARIEVVEPGTPSARPGGEPGLVRLDALPGAASALIGLADGRACVLPALQGFIGHVRVDDRGVASVSYVPSTNDERWDAYADVRDRIDRLRSKVALAIDQNALTLRSDDEALRLADEIRMGKGIDPALGVYAAHTYSQAGRDDLVRDVAMYLEHDLGVDLYDVRLLGSRQPEMGHTDGIVPICPMLTQAWSLLRPRGVAVPPPLAEAAGHLCPSLWTTFRPDGADALFDAVDQGALG